MYSRPTLGYESSFQLNCPTTKTPSKHPTKHPTRNPTTKKPTEHPSVTYFSTNDYITQQGPNPNSDTKTYHRSERGTVADTDAHPDAATVQHVRTTGRGVFVCCARRVDAARQHRVLHVVARVQRHGCSVGVHGGMCRCVLAVLSRVLAHTKCALRHARRGHEGRRQCAGVCAAASQVPCPTHIAL